MPKKRKELVYDVAFAGVLREGMRTPFWVAMTEIIEREIDNLSYQIIHDDTLSEQMMISKRDFMRKWLSYQEELLTLPKKIADFIDRPTEQSDPFRKVENGIKGIL